MRRITLRKAALALSIAAFGYCIPAQGQSVTEELLLQSPGVHQERNLDGIINELETLGGISYVGFCPNQNIILLRVDRKIQHDDKLIMETFTQKKLEIHIKGSATHAQVIAACPSMHLSSTDPSSDPGSGGE